MRRDLPLTVVFVSQGYLRLLANWLQYARKFCGGNLLVCALDDESCSWSEARGLRAHLIQWDEKLNSLWKTRVSVVRQLVADGYTVVHSDVDAIWNRNPLDRVSGVKADIIFSQGTIWPHDVHEKTGAILCCGFFMIRSGPGAEQFMDAWCSAMRSDDDDQRAVNRLLAEMGMRWGEADYTITFADREFRCFRDTQYFSADSGLEVALLPHREFQRIPEKYEATVAHYFSEKSGAESESVLRDHNLWSSGL
jgi:hypothetical protein